jgi:hypothetical protein
MADTKEVKELSWTEQQSLYTKMKERGERFNSRFRERLSQRVNLGKLSEEVSVELYAKYFSESELRDLITFYKSPTGKKIMEITPVFMAESMAKADERLAPILKELTKEMSANEQAEIEAQLAEFVKATNTATPRTRTNKARVKRN